MAGEDKLSPTGLEKITYKQIGWNYILDRNFDIINNTLSKVGNLFDVDMTKVKNGVTIGWNATTSKWEPMYPFTSSSTTTSSSSTSSSSSSSTTTTTAP